MWKNLAPKLIRQRVIIEGTTSDLVGKTKIKSYLLKLAKVARMEIVQGPLIFAVDNGAHGILAKKTGYCGWCNWRTSGSHFYSYPTTPPLFTVDIYTCKRFNVKKIVAFTKKYLNAIEIVHKEIEV